MASHSFSEEQLNRYARHIVLPEVGGAGQQRLLDSHVFVIGAGGIGSPVLLYLAAAGVGTIEVIDDDTVDLSNLQRQILFGNPDIGTPKVEAAANSIHRINPGINVIVHQERLTTENAKTLLSNAEVIIDGSDNFPTRYLVNDTAYELRKPLVSGAMHRFEGQVTVFPNDHKPESPCYRCLYPEAPEPGLIPSCKEAGILGVVPGVIGSICATEAIKILLGKGDTLADRLLSYDALAMSFREFRIRRNAKCKLNGEGA